MGAQSAWRLAFSASQGGQYIQLTEVAFLDGSGADLSVGGAPSASSEYSSTYSAAKAFDKSLSTDWCTVSGALPAWLQYTHASAVDVAQVRIVCSANSSWLPSGAEQLGLYAGSLQQDRYSLALVSGSFVPNATVVLSVSPYIPPQIVPLPPSSGCLQCAPYTPFSGLAPVIQPGRLLQNFLSPQRPSTGVVSDRVMFKATPSSPESPFAMGRVWLLRLVDGYKAWEGWSDAQGYYTATGLELGVEYIAVGIDPLRNHKATGAGPVLAVEAP